jgi:hypothetical protein
MRVEIDAARESEISSQKGAIAKAIAAERERIRRIAEEMGAVCFTEPRPCQCKPGCSLITPRRHSFANILDLAFLADDCLQG